MEEALGVTPFRDALHHVPWADLSHAYGVATDTPHHLLALLSHDADTRGQALGELWASICHQGSVYEASCAAVPFLIRLLHEGPSEGRPAVLYLLAGLAHRDRGLRRRRPSRHDRHLLLLDDGASGRRAQP